MTIDYEPGGSTMIRVNLGTKKKLEGMKKDKNEGIDDVINRLIQENRKMKRLDKDPVPALPLVGMPNALPAAVPSDVPTKILAPDQPCLMPDLNLPAWRTTRSMPAVPTTEMPK